MVGPQGLLEDREGPLEQRAGAVEVALGLKQLAEVIEAGGNPGIIGL